MKNTRHAATNYRKLWAFLGDMLHGPLSYKRFESDGYMPLVLEKLHCNDHKGRPVYSLAHYGQQNGDAMRDPELTFSVDEYSGTIEPLTFQNDYVGLYQEVYITNDAGQLCYSPRLRSSLDDFLWHWLDNIQEQGYQLADSN